jgi:hypothetical protein
MMLEVLDGAFVFFRGRTRFESPEVPAFAGLGIPFP